MRGGRRDKGGDGRQETHEGNTKEKKAERGQDRGQRPEDRAKGTSSTRPFPSSVKVVSGVLARGNLRFPTPGMALSMLTQG